MVTRGSTKHSQLTLAAKDLVNEIWARIEECLRRYRITLGGHVVLGLSGGKDSTALLIVLREMAVPTTPVVVDLGYSNFNAEAVAAMARDLGFDPVVKSARSASSLSMLLPEVRSQVQSDLSRLDLIGTHTPCSACTQVKRSLLADAAQRIGTPFVVFAHHQDDFVTTILKDYFVARYYSTHGTYHLDSFRSFIENDEVSLSALALMVENRAASTMAIRTPLTSDITLVRPMACVPESMLAGLITEAGVKVFGSGCSHDVFFGANSQPTKRELVHRTLARRLHDHPALAADILSVALRSLDEHGRPFSNPRRRRAQLYPGFSHD